jgi:hypothetical protein
MTADLIALVATAAIWAQAFLAVSVLLARGGQDHTPVALAFVFLVLAAASGGPLIDAVLPGHTWVLYELTVAAYALLGPAVLFYVRGLTAEAPWRFVRRDLTHFIPALCGVMLVVLDVTVPAFTPPAGLGWTRTAYVAVVATLWIGLIIAIAGHLVLVGRRLVARLSAYQTRWKALFAHDEGNLRWLRLLLVAGAGFWIILLMATIIGNVLGQTLLDRRAVALVFLALTWSLGLWGLNQRPAFSRHYDELVETTVEPEEEARKYARSGLSGAQA